MCIRAFLPRVSVNVFFSNERCTLLLWTIIAVRFNSPVPNLQLLEQKAESIFDELNNSHIGVIQRAVLHMKVRAQRCLRANGSYFEGKKQFA